MYSDEDLLPLSGVQHILFCERQCALIHIEQCWKENALTQEGRVMHERVHEGKNESRPSKRSEFGIDIHSLSLGLVGKTDAVYFQADGSVKIVEYKRGKPKENKSDEVQLCAQSICLEEMLGIMVTEAYLFYGKTKHRLGVPLTPELRVLTEESALRFHALVERGITPQESRSKKCDACSLAGICLPGKKGRPQSVSKYINRCIEAEK